MIIGCHAYIYLRAGHQLPRANQRPPTFGVSLIAQSSDDPLCSFADDK
jgi:hypothetical protein